MRRSTLLAALFLTLSTVSAFAQPTATTKAGDAGMLPVGDDGKPL